MRPWWILALGLSACSPPAEPRPPTPRPAADPIALPSWCTAVERASGGLGDFRCMNVPNYLVTGFFGPAHNPERSDFENACFGGNTDAASRLRLSVRPAASLSLEYRAVQRLGAGGQLDLGFLGPWAPRLGAQRTTAKTACVRVELQDAEIRVLPSVAEILRQQYAESAAESELHRSLEACIDTFCDPQGEALSYTAKVLAATVVIIVNADELEQTQVQVGVGSARFELDKKASKTGELVLRAKEKLNIAALVEPAAPAFAQAKTCELVRQSRARTETLSSLGKFCAATAAGRELAEAAKQASGIRTLLDRGGFSDSERTALMSTLGAVETLARESSKKKPGAGLCQGRRLVEAVLGSSAKDSRVHVTLVDLLAPIEHRIGDLANEHSLPCADPLWFKDLDRDGFGDPKASKRAEAQPPGYVANGLDCYDQNPEAHPGQDRYFAQHRGDKSFDYDCDGRDSKKDDVVSEGCRSSTTLGIVTKCWADVGWQSKTPECGQQGKWLASCDEGTLSCSPAEEPRRVQECR
ncbi:MAG: hypothetical protein R3B13_36420 [Polyangiaceae bacterium]